MTTYVYILLITLLVSIKVVCGDNFDCFEFFNVTESPRLSNFGIYVGSSKFPAGISLENRPQCQFHLAKELGGFIFIITNGYLRNVRITSDKVVR